MHEPFFVDSLKRAVLGGKPLDKDRFRDVFMPYLIIFEAIFARTLSGLHETLQELQLEQTTDRRSLHNDREGYDRVGHVDDRRLLG